MLKYGFTKMITRALVLIFSIRNLKSEMEELKSMTTSNQQSATVT